MAHKNSQQFKSGLYEWDIAHKRVIVRADLNIEGDIERDNLRLQALLPTLDLILKKKGKIVLITHRGRPKCPTPALSTQHLMPFFMQHYCDTTFADITHVLKPAHALTSNSSIVLLENIRFFPEEKQGDERFAQVLAQWGDFYVNDGFGVLHRSDCSVTRLPLLFPKERRTFGLLVEKELNELTPLTKNPPKPFVLIMGGAKIAEKIPLIAHMIPRIDRLLLCPAIVFTFKKARNNSVGKSLVDEHSLDICKQIMETARAHNVDVMFPADYQVAQYSLNGPVSYSSLSYTSLSYTPDDTIQADEVGISIGPKTSAAWSSSIQEARTLFFNGSMGFLNVPETLGGVNALLDQLARAPGHTIVAGGDSVAAAYKHGVHESIDYLSTGGGSALAYLSGQQLPGLTVLL